MNKVIRFIPLILFVVLAVVLYRGLFLNPQAMPSALVGKKMPSFNLTEVHSEAQLVTEQDLADGILLFNVWGTWCPTCRYEHPFFMKLAQQGRVKIYGVNYQDERELAINWLKALGNPYEFSVFDPLGKLSRDLGVTGAPETFVVDHNKIIRKRFQGAVTEEVWQTEFEPLIQLIEQEQRAAKGQG